MSLIAIDCLPCTCQPAEVAASLITRLAQPEEAGLVFLDSGDRHQTSQQMSSGRFSVLAQDPWLDIRFQDQKTWLNGHPVSEGLFATIRTFLQEHAGDLPVGVLPRDLPFQAGLVGYFAYDLAAALDPEHVPLPEASDHDLPLVWLRAYDQMIVFDRQEQTAWLLAWGQLQPAHEALDGMRDLLNTAMAAQIGLDSHPGVCAQDQSEIRSGMDRSSLAAGHDLVQLESNFTRPAYLERVSQVRTAIGAGEVYILNLTQRMILPRLPDPFRTYLELRQKSPTPYAAFMAFPGLAILSFSPELFLKISDRQAVTRPIKGTRPRGQTPELDEKNRQALLQSAKDRAELLMIVDLERNDLSRVCTPESVSVKDLYGLESYATVHHLVATVSGELASEHDAVSCFAALFPGGSITGAPKMRAMQLISSFETVRRGLYTGCLGFFSLDGQAAFNILIRTIFQSDQATTYHAGGGITWDSDPAAEYQETLDKTIAIAEAFQC